MSRLVGTILLLLPVQPLFAQDAPKAKVLTLDAALETARANNPTLRNAAAQADAADARRDAARAPLLPVINGTAAYLRTNTAVRTSQNTGVVPGGGATGGATPVAASDDFFNLFQVGLTGSIVLYDFNGSIDRFRSSKESVRSFAERQRAAELSVEFGVRQAFFQARAQQAMIRVAREALANNQRHLDQVQAFVEVGSRPEIDVRQVRTEVANAKVGLVQAENAARIAKVTLQRAMGVEDDYDFEVADERLSAVPDENATLEVLLKEAVEKRPDMRALGRDLRASKLTASAASGRFGPTISGLGQLNKQWIGSQEQRMSLFGGVQANWQLLRSGATFAERHEAKANARAVEANIGELRQTVRLQVEQARLGVHAAIAVLEAAAEATENARARLTLAEGRYEAGVGNVIELGDAQVAFTQAEAQSVSAEYSLSVARAQLLSALGRSR